MCPFLCDARATEDAVVGDGRRGRARRGRARGERGEARRGEGRTDGRTGRTSVARGMASSSASTTRKVRVVVVGDSGVGKTSLARWLARGARGTTEEEDEEEGSVGVGGSASRTSGCRVEVILANGDESARSNGGGEEDEEDVARAPYFVELWDVGGHRQYKRERGIFYDQINGVIIVHDASSRASGARCEAWAREVAARGSFSAPTERPAETYANAESPCVMYGFGGLPVPCLIVANKIDLEGRAGRNDDFTAARGFFDRVFDVFGRGGDRGDPILPATFGDVARDGSKFTHRRQSSFGSSALAKLPPGRGLRTSVALGRVELDVVNNFFRELVHRRYAKSVVTAGASAPFVSERLLHSGSAPFVEDDEDDLT